MRWLYSTQAIQAHLLFLGSIALFTFALLSGDKVRPASEYSQILAFLCIGYPTALLLLWLLHRTRTREAERERRFPTPAWRARRFRKRGRVFSLVFLWAVALVLCYLGSQGWEWNQIPAHYGGLIFVLFAASERLGVNIWYGGPFDLRLDLDDTEGEVSSGR
jgi:hypothetical protein